MSEGTATNLCFYGICGAVWLAMWAWPKIVAWQQPAERPTGKQRIEIYFRSDLERRRYTR